MKTSHTILLDLAAGQTAIHHLAERLRQPRSVLKGFIDDLITDGLVESADIGNPHVGRRLIVYRLTDPGRQAAAALKERGRLAHS